MIAAILPSSAPIAVVPPIADPLDLAAVDFSEASPAIGGTPLIGIGHLPLFRTGPELRAAPPSSSSAVPEPSTWSAMLAGFGMIGLLLRHGRRSAPDSRNTDAI